jgi:guanine deaminase
MRATLMMACCLSSRKIQALLPWQEGEQYLHPQRAISTCAAAAAARFCRCPRALSANRDDCAFGEQLLEWLTTYTFPVESQFADEEYAAEIAQFFINQLLSHGTTTALVFCTLHPESVDALFSEALRLNMRLLAGKVMMDRHAPDYLSETAEQSYRQTRELIQRWHHRGRLGYAITPRFAPTSTPELLTAVQRLREEFPDTWLHTHLSENLNEMAWVKSLWPEHEHYLDVYHHYRLTGERSVFAHGFTSPMRSGDACTRPARRSPSARPQTCFSAAVCSACPPAGSTRCVWASAATSARARPSVCCALWAKPIKWRSCKAIVCAPAKPFTMPRWEAPARCVSMRRLATSSRAKRPTLSPSPGVTPLQRLRLSRCQDIYEQLFVLMTLGDERNIHQTWVNGECVWQTEAE